MDKASARCMYGVSRSADSTWSTRSLQKNTARRSDTWRDNRYRLERSGFGSSPEGLQTAGRLMRVGFVIAGSAATSSWPHTRGVRFKARCRRSRGWSSLQIVHRLRLPQCWHHGGHRSTSQHRQGVRNIIRHPEVGVLAREEAYPCWWRAARLCTAGPSEVQQSLGGGPGRSDEASRAWCCSWPRRAAQVEEAGSGSRR